MSCALTVLDVATKDLHVCRGVKASSHVGLGIVVPTPSTFGYAMCAR